MSISHMIKKNLIWKKLNTSLNNYTDKKSVYRDVLFNCVVAFKNIQNSFLSNDIKKNISNPNFQVAFNLVLADISFYLYISQKPLTFHSFADRHQSSSHPHTQYCPRRHTFKYYQNIFIYRVLRTLRPSIHTI